MATRSLTAYAREVALKLGDFGQWGESRCVRFADGEMEVEVRSSLRGKDVFLFAGAARNSSGISVEENKIELYHTIDAIKRSDAGRITLFEPYFSSSRSDRTTRRNSVGFWIHTKTLISLGVNHIVTFQLHSDKSKTAIDPTLCAIDDIPVDPLVAAWLARSRLQGRPEAIAEAQRQWLFCSVDAGGEKLAKHCAQGFGTRLVVAHKQRDYHQQNCVESITLLTDTTLKGREIWIVDDMIDTAGSVATLVEELVRREVAVINIAIVHAVFSPPAVERLQALHAKGWLSSLLCTDTIEITPELQQALPFLRVVPTAGLAAEIVRRVHAQQSLSSLFNPFSLEDAH